MQILNLILSYIKCLLDFVLLFWLSSQFFTRRDNRHPRIAYASLPCLAFCLFLFNRYHIPQLNTVISVLCAAAINFIFFNAVTSSILLCSIMEIVLIVICEFLPIFFYTLVFRINIAAVTYETIANSAFSLISTGLFCIFILLLRHVLSAKHQKEYGLTIKENFSIIVVPLISIFIIYYILHIHNLNSSIDHGFIAVESILVFLGILIMNLIAIIGDNSTRRQYQLQQELDRLNRLEKSNQIMLEQQDQFIDELKGYAHDYAKQIHELRALINSRQSDTRLDKDLQTYVEELYASIEENHLFSFIPITALRAILSQTQIRCNTERIHFTANIQYTDFSFIKFADLYAIFNNPLSNAIEACCSIQPDSKRFINLTIFKKNHLIWITIVNPIGTPIIVKKGILQTTKPDAEWHGYGLKSMKHAVNRYGGYANIEYSQDEFSIAIALPLPENML